MNKKEIMEVIDNAISRKIEETGVMGTEQVKIMLEVTINEFKNFLDVEKYDTINYSFEYEKVSDEGGILYIIYSEEV